MRSSRTRALRTEVSAWQEHFALVMVLTGLLLAACSGSPSPGTGTDDTTPPPTSAAPTDPGVVGGNGEGEDGAVVAGLVGVEVEVSNAVAPFDHHSNVDSLLLELSLSRAMVQMISDCRVAEGFPPVPISPLPDRDDPILMANAAFPYVEALARDGLPNLPGAPESPDDRREPSEAEREASRRCAQEVDESGDDIVVARTMWANVRSAWEAVLGEIEATDEIRSLVDEFGSCLRGEGIPPEYASSEIAYLSYVDELLFRSGDDERARADIHERMGKLYVECGRELFEARERLRGGEHREAFLREHEETIRELSDLLYGPGAGGSTP